MKFTISIKNFTLTRDQRNHIVEYHINKINRLFPTLNPDGDELDILIRKNHKHEKMLNLPKLSKPIYYNGELKLTLPMKVLVVHLFGTDLEEVLNNGFSKLIREIQVYKGTHFKSRSQYKNHKTVRGHEDEYFTEIISM